MCLTIARCVNWCEDNNNNTRERVAAAVATGFVLDETISFESCE